MGRVKELWNDRDNQLRYFKWLMYYSKPYAWKIMLLMSIDLITTLVSLKMVTLSKTIIDNATNGQSFKTAIIVYIILMISMQAVGVFSGIFSTMLNEKFGFGIRKQVYEKIIRSHWLDIKKYHTGDLMTRLTSDAGAIADGIINTIPSVIRLSIELVLVFFTLFRYSRMLALFALLVAPVSAVTCWWLGRKLKRLQVKVQESEALYRSFLQESMANLLIVKAFANEDYASERLTNLRENRFYWVFKRTKLSMASSVIMGFSFQLGYIAAFTYGALQVSLKAITYGTMSVFLALVNRVQSPIMGLAKTVPQVVSILASAGRVIEIQNIPEEKSLPTDMARENIGVKVNDLTFGYTDETVFENVNLDIKPGEFVAIIGESGIGKTTLVRIIMSFTSSLTGSVDFYNAYGEGVVANSGTREFIAYVPQGNTLFSGTIRENIRMGKLDATDEEMWEALRLASGEEFVRNLPGGLDCVIGERGHGISEGQAQRIAIARAFVRKSPFLILDEATSSLDENTELQVLKGLQELNPRPTCLIITHRKSILPICDREIKIENKKTIITE
ncbi:ABC-type multidrug transport system, ATPase and permease component [Lachnospiraceae bacterium YSD2013]|nr:ABC-type multidrug transport system, ATPase and permease component [Lachnospiraceae bacterium YSD2013]